MQLKNRKLERNEDGSLKIFNHEELPDNFRGEYDDRNNCKFILGSYESIDGRDFAWVLPVPPKQFNAIPQSELESYATLRLDACTY